MKAWHGLYCKTGDVLLEVAVTHLVLALLGCLNARTWVVVLGTGMLLVPIGVVNDREEGRRPHHTP